MSELLKKIIAALIALILAILAAIFALFNNNGDSPPINLPDISQIMQNKTDTFIVPIQDFGGLVEGVMPMPGSASACYHPGAHVEFPQTASLQTVDIIAPVDGVISMVDKCYPYGTLDQYKIHMHYAQRNNYKFELEIGLEPMGGNLCSGTGDPDFFAPYILVQEGQAVNKGDVIGQMVLLPSSKSHIHFNSKFLQYPNVFMCPDIFSDTLINQIDDNYMGNCQSQPFTTIATGTLCYMPGTQESHNEY